MNFITTLLPAPLTYTIGWTLIHFLWQGLAAAAVLFALLKIMRNTSANARYLTACLILTATVIMPIATFSKIAPPQFAIPATPSVIPAKAGIQHENQLAKGGSNSLPTANPVKPTNSVSPATPSVIPAQAGIQHNNQPAKGGSNSLPTQFNFAQSIEQYFTHIAAIYFAGVILLSVWHLGGYTQVQRLRRQLISDTSQRIQQRLAALCNQMQITRAVQIAESQLVHVPTVIGALKPIILLPASALSGLTADQLHAILAHELAHIKRHDYLVNILQTATEILGFYHPAVWWINAKIRAERENACDDIAVKTTGNKIHFAKALTTMAESHASLALTAAGPKLIDRITRLLTNDPKPQKNKTAIPAAIAILILTTIIPIALAINNTTPPKPPQQTPSQYKTTLPNGTTVELIGLCQHPSENKQWWKPDGNKLANTPYEIKNVSVSTMFYRKALEAVIKVDGFDNGIGFRYKIEGTQNSGSSGSGDQKLNGIIFDQAKGTQQTNIKIGIASGKWQTIQTQKSNFGGVINYDKTTWFKPIETNGKTVLNTAHSLIEQNTRIIAIDKKGKEHEGGSTSSTKKGIESIQTTFKLPLSKIKEFNFQTRPYQWVTFKNVSLKPNFKTDVQIKQTKTNQSQITPPPSTDILAKDFDIRPYPAGGLYTATVAIQNAGSTTLPEFRLNFYRGNPAKKLNLHSQPNQGHNNAGPIEPNETCNESSQPFELKEGQNHIHVFLDTQNKIKESNESNNAAHLTITVKNNQIINKSLSLTPPQHPWLNARTVIFPTDRSIGMLKKREWSPTSRHPDEDLAEAQGKVNVPAGYMLGLEFPKDKPLDLSPLADLNPSDLQNLYLYRTQVKDSDLQYITHLTGLVQIGLAITNISDEGLKYLSNLQNLKELNLAKTKITDAALAHLANLRNLQTLLLADNAITDNGLINLRNLNKLQTLRLSNTKITDNGLHHLSKLNSLNRLGLSGTNINGTGLSHLKNLPSLKWLILSDTPINDDALIQIGKMKNLQGLYLNHTQITDTGVSHLKNLNQLEQLILADTNITDQSLKHLETLSNLKSLNLNNTPITEPALKTLMQALPNCDIMHEKMQTLQIPVLIEQLGHKEALKRNIAMNNLARIGLPAVPALTEALKSKNPNTRKTAAQALGIIGPKAKPAIEPLTLLTQDQNNLVRAEAAMALKKINPQNNLIAHWKFDENAGNIAHDSAGNNNAIIQGANWSSGISGTGLNFDGLDDYVNCGSDTSLDLTEFTWSLWIKRTEQWHSDERSLISTNQADQHTNGSYGLQIDEGDNFQNTIQFVRHGDPFSACLWSNTTIGDTTWHHIAATRNNKKQAVIYIDGQPVAQGRLQTKTDFKQMNIAAGDKEYSNFKGIIDEVKIYNRALSTKQIQQIYNNTNNSYVTSNKTNREHNNLYKKQDSIKNALFFIGTPEDRMTTGSVDKRGQLAGPKQLVFVNKLFKANFDKDVELFLSILSKGTKKEVNNNWNMAYLFSNKIENGTFLPTDDENTIKFFAVSREFTDKDLDPLKDNVSWPEMPTHVITVFHFSQRGYMLTGSSLYVAKDGPDYKLICPTNLKVPFTSPAAKTEDKGPKEYGIAAFKQDDEAYTKSVGWKYQWDIELSKDISNRNTFQVLKLTKVILGQADLHPEIAAQKIIDESVIEKYKHKGLKCRLYVGDSEPSYTYSSHGQKMSGWPCGFSMASMSRSKNMFFPGKDVTNIKTNKQGNFIGSDLELLSFETSEENIKYEHKVILRKTDSASTPKPEFKATLEARIEGKVVEKGTNIGVGGVRLILYEKQNSVGPFDVKPVGVKPVVSKDDGTFSFEALDARAYILKEFLFLPQKQTAEWIFQPVTVNTETGKTSNVVIELSKGGLLEVVVKDDEKRPVEGATMYVKAKKYNLSRLSAKTDANGVAAIRLAPGEYEFQRILHKEGYLPQEKRSTRQTVTIEEGKTLRIETKLKVAPKISGVVTDPNGKTLEGAAVSILPTVVMFREAKTDQNGMFEISWNPKQRGTLTPHSILVVRHVDKNLAKVVDINEATRSLDVKLDPGVILTGKVIDPSSKAIGGAQISMNISIAKSGTPFGYSGITTDQNGRYKCNAMPDNEKFNIYARAEGYGNDSIMINTDGAVNNRIEIKPLMLRVADKVVCGIVVDGDDKPIANAHIVVNGGDGHPYHRVKSDANGEFIIDKLCDGKVRLRAGIKDGADYLSGNVNTKAGAIDVKMVVTPRLKTKNKDSNQSTAQITLSLHVCSIADTPLTKDDFEHIKTIIGPANIPASFKPGSSIATAGTMQNLTQRLNQNQFTDLLTFLDSNNYLTIDTSPTILLKDNEENEIKNTSNQQILTSYIDSPHGKAPGRTLMNYQQKCKLAAKAQILQHKPQFAKTEIDFSSTSLHLEKHLYKKNQYKDKYPYYTPTTGNLDTKTSILLKNAKPAIISAFQTLAKDRQIVFATASWPQEKENQN
jgi:beta-lactamase regulating signal transducer with metallopeptidase domain/Leucine-rich repeat (LRR) protein